MIQLDAGDIIKMKKKHPCGSDEWELIRVGVDFKLKCTKCGHLIILERPKAIKIIKGIKEV